jgi:hypothetical protein
MKKVWNFILKNRIYIVLVLFILFCGFVFVTMKAYLDPVDELAVYGNRLDGIEDVEITENRKDEVNKFIKEDENVTDSSISVQGKIVNISIKTTTKGNTISKMQEKGKLIIEKFSKEEIAFYDFQIFIKNEDANYNMIGYKNKKNENISWESDEIVREVEENEEEQ